MAVEVWPASGVALALLWRFGPRYWPGVFAAVVVASIRRGYPVGVSLLFAVGNSFAALVGVLRLRRIHRFKASLDRLSDVIRLDLAIALAPIVSASIGVLAISTAHIHTGTPLEAWP